MCMSYIYICEKGMSMPKLHARQQEDSILRILYNYHIQRLHANSNKF